MQCFQKFADPHIWVSMKFGSFTGPRFRPLQNVYVIHFDCCTMVTFIEQDLGGGGDRLSPRSQWSPIQPFERLGNRLGDNFHFVDNMDCGSNIPNLWRNLKNKDVQRIGFYLFEHILLVSRRFLCLSPDHRYWYSVSDQTIKVQTWNSTSFRLLKIINLYGYTQ